MTDMLPIKRLAQVTLGKMVQPEPKSVNEVEAPYVRAAHVQPDGRFIELPEQRMWFTPTELRALELRRGDVIVVEGGAGYGRSAMLTEDLSGWGFQNSIIRLRARDGLAHGKFIDYALQSALRRGHVGLVASTATIPHFTAEKVGRFEVPAPLADEQQRIAEYLDREMAQIDALIAKQEQLIGTLRERRQAVLDTEFEALGAKRVQLRRGIRFLTSGSRGWGDYYADEGERFLRIGNLPRTNLTLRGDIQYVELPSGVTEGSRTRLRGDDLLFSITAYLGSVAVVTDEWVGAYVSQHVALCRLTPSMFDSQFVGYFMLTTEGQDQLKLGAAGGTKVQLALDDIKALSVPLVPLGAQGKIVASIEAQVSRIDALIAKAEEFIGLARERRAALITEAVTGKIDVSTGKAREGA